MRPASRTLGVLTTTLVLSVAVAGAVSAAFTAPATPGQPTPTTGSIAAPGASVPDEPTGPGESSVPSESTGPDTATLDLQPVDLAGSPDGGTEGVFQAVGVGIDGVVIAGGQIETQLDGTSQPVVVESSDGRAYATASIGMTSGLAGGDISAIGTTPLGAVAAGTVRRSDDSVRPAVWLRSSGGWEGPFVVDTASLAGGTAVEIDDVTIGTAGAVMAGRIDGSPVVWTSVDGRSWTEATGIGADDRVLAVASRGVVVVLVESADDSGIARFDLLVGDVNGRFNRNEAPFGETGLVRVQDLVATDLGFEAVGQQTTAADAPASAVAWSSPDGSSWVSMPTAFPPNAMSGQNAALPRSVSFGRGGLVAYDGAGTVWKSVDGVTFVEVPTAGRPPAPFIGVASGAVVVGITANTAYANDGSGWLQSPSLLPAATFRSEVASISMIGGTWFAVGVEMTPAPSTEPDGSTAAALIWTSPDGRTWTRQAVGDPVLAGIRLSGVAGAENGFVAVGQYIDLPNQGQAAIVTSPDGVTWARVEHPELLPVIPGARSLVSAATGPIGGVIAVGAYADGSAPSVTPLVLQLAGGVVNRISTGLVENPFDASGVCTVPGSTLIVGGGRAFVSNDATQWRPVSLTPLTSASRCAADAERFAVSGFDTSAGRAELAVLVGPASATLSPVPVDRPIGDITPPDVAFAADSVLVGARSGSDGILWFGDTSGLRIVRSPVLAGPGEQDVRSVAIGADFVLAGGSAQGRATIWLAPRP